MGVVPRLSIPRRIFLGFALVLVASGVVSIVSFLQHERNGAALSLLHSGYLPLALTVSEARATQQVFNTLLDRLLTERDTGAPRLWLQAARQRRPRTVEEVGEDLARISAMVPREDESAALSRLTRQLHRVRS